MAELMLDSVSQSYAKRQIIANLSFTLPAGAIGCLLGPSDCDKATALRCISSFEPVESGEIRLVGEREVFALADWAGMMHPGRIQQWDTPYDLYHEPANRLVGQGALPTSEVINNKQVEFLYTLKLPSGQRALPLVPSHHNHPIGERIGTKLAVDHVVAFRNE